MEKLNYDCLCHIYSFLSPSEILTMERVCKHLRRASIEQFWLSVWTLNINDLLRIHGDLQIIDLINMIKRCKNLREFIYSNYKFTNLSSAVLLITITESCPNLEVINLCGITTTSYDVLHLSSGCRNLKKILLRPISVDDDIFIQAFKYMKNLEYVCIERNRCWTGSCLPYLPKNLRELHIHNAPKLQSHTLIKSIKEWRNFEALRMDRCLNLPEDFLTELVSAAPSMKYLSLCYTLVFLRPIQYFSKLESLYLFGNSQVTDEILKMISEYCPLLSTLSLGDPMIDENGQEIITALGISYLSRLLNLNKLILKNMESVDFECIICVVANGTITSLQVTDCRLFNDDVAYAVIYYCKNLKNLDIQECPVTPDMIRLTVEELEKQTNRRSILKINIRHCFTSKYTEGVPFHPHPFLSVIVDNISR